MGWRIGPALTRSTRSAMSTRRTAANRVVWIKWVGISWTQLEASQCKAPKDGTFVEKTLIDIIAVIISAHHRSYTGLCFPNAWDPTRPLILENNDEVRLKSLYDLPNNCPCDYEIP